MENKTTMELQNEIKQLKQEVQKFELQKQKKRERQRRYYKNKFKLDDDMSDEALIVKALQRMLPQTSSNFLFPDRPEVLEDTSFAVKGVEYAGQDSERSNLRTEWDKNLLKEFRTQLDIEERRAQDESIETGTVASKASYLDLYKRALATLKQNYYPFSP